MMLFGPGNRSSTRDSTGRTRAAVTHDEKRRAARSDRLGTGTLACGRCDAPIAIGPRPLVVTDVLTCPFCDHRGPLRDFLSMAAPTRPARVIVRVSIRS
jgi:hypothetical protein